MIRRRRLVVTREAALCVRRIALGLLDDTVADLRMRNPAVSEAAATALAGHVLAATEPTIWRAFRESLDVLKRDSSTAQIAVRPPIPDPPGRQVPAMAKPS